MPPSDADTFAVDMAEFERLRQEIDNRMTLAYALLTLELAALGTGVTVVATLPVIALALAFVSSFLWLLWVDHVGQIYKIASYIGIQLGARLSGGVPRLGWEQFLREVNAGGPRAERVLYPGRRPPEEVYVGRTDPDSYTSLLFGGAPLALLASFAYAQIRDGTPWHLVLLALVPPAALWVFASSRFLSLKRTIGTLNRAISASVDAPSAG